ncbi:hypothetical protein AAFF_G00021980 [Aldrovandia affinis]|uniref:Uncharacterized protein n=1 Tax=Aldrovandia affinis TaxID=143900 RepID=A0AAD7S546_9TELE|nr:hypothetical protein AAFF_G00021980 [Aldrovandia affinis]
MHPYPLQLPQWCPLATVSHIDSTQVQGGCDVVLRNPQPREVEMDVQTTQVPVVVGWPLALPQVDGLTPEQHRQVQALLQWWVGVFEDSGFTNAVLHHIPIGNGTAKGIAFSPQACTWSCGPC